MTLDLDEFPTGFDLKQMDAASIGGCKHPLAVKTETGAPKRSGVWKERTNGGSACKIPNLRAMAVPSARGDNAAAGQVEFSADHIKLLESLHE